MITVIFNNKPVHLPESSTLLAFLENNLAAELRPVCAIAVNRQFVSREQQARLILREQDVIDLVSPMQGG